jgi:hypothetical protein
MKGQKKNRQAALNMIKLEISETRQWHVQFYIGIRSKRAHGKIAMSLQWKPLGRLWHINVKDINSFDKFARWFIHNVTEENGIYTAKWNRNVHLVEVARIDVLNKQVTVSRKSILYRWLINELERRDGDERLKRLFY